MGISHISLLSLTGSDCDQMIQVVLVLQRLPSCTNLRELMFWVTKGDSCQMQPDLNFFFGFAQIDHKAVQVQMLWIPNTDPW